MNEQVWWYVARASGITSWFLLMAAVVWGLLLSTGLLGRRPRPAWLLDLHRFLGALAVVFLVVHVGGLVGDSYVHFGAADVLVPFASEWQTGAVAAGIVAGYLLVAVEVTSLLQRRLPRSWWRGVHLTSFGAAFLASLHGAAAGTDATVPAYRIASIGLLLATVFLTIARILGGGRGRRDSAVARPRPDRQAVHEVAA